MISFRDVTYYYPGSKIPALKHINLNIPTETLTLVTGVSGSGKSTLIRCINGLIPHFSGGEFSGTVDVCGMNPVLESPQKMSLNVGFVFQDPESQFILNRVDDEVAFALENSSIPRSEIKKRIDEIMDLFDLQHLRNRTMESLSGGEKQKVALAASMVMKPSILILDEPTSQLDPTSANEILGLLVALVSQRKMTVILSEHRLERILPFTGHMIHLGPQCNSFIEGSPRYVLANINLVSPMIDLAKHLGWEPLPLSIEEGIVHARNYHPPPLLSTSNNHKDENNNKPVLKIEDLRVQLKGNSILKGINFNLERGETVVLMGKNGSGKTTLLRSIVKLVKPEHGKIYINDVDTQNQSTSEICRTIGYLPQDPNALLYADTVIDELRITLDNHHLNEIEYNPDQLLCTLRIAEKSESYPRDLSGGEKQRVAIGAVTVTRPLVILLDEPTRGLDYRAKQDLISLVKTWSNRGTAILLVTHDVELAANIADRIVIIDSGEIKLTGKPVDLLEKTPIFNPEISQLFPGTGVLTLQDVINQV